jgi:hypothetical protein
MLISGRKRSLSDARLSVAFARDQRQARIAGENAGFGFDQAGAAQFAQRLGSAHDDVGIKARLDADVDDRVAELEAAVPHGGDDDWLRQGYDRDVVQDKVGEARVSFRPVPERVVDAAAKQRREIISLGEDHQVVGAADMPGDVRHPCPRMPVERAKAGWRAAKTGQETKRAPAVAAPVDESVEAPLAPRPPFKAGTNAAEGCRKQRTCVLCRPYRFERDPFASPSPTMRRHTVAR